MQWPTARITHVGLHVSDIEAMADFYERALGMNRMKGAQGRFATLSFGYQHHDIAFLPAAPGRARGAPGSVGLHHICIDVQSYDAWVQAYGRLVDEGVKVSYILDHRTGIGIYFNDPDGNKLEVWCENFPTMDEAIRQGKLMAEEFEENYNGYWVDPNKLYEDYLEAKAAAAKSPAKGDVELV